MDGSPLMGLGPVALLNSLATLAAIAVWAAAVIVLGELRLRAVMANGAGVRLVALLVATGLAGMAARSLAGAALINADLAELLVAIPRFAYLIGGLAVLLAGLLDWREERQKARASSGGPSVPKPAGRRRAG